MFKIAIILTFSLCKEHTQIYCWLFRGFLNGLRLSILLGLLCFLLNRCLCLSVVLILVVFLKSCFFFLGWLSKEHAKIDGRLFWYFLLLFLCRLLSRILMVLPGQRLVQSWRRLFVRTFHKRRSVIEFILLIRNSILLKLLWLPILTLAILITEFLESLVLFLNSLLFFKIGCHLILYFFIKYTLQLIKICTGMALTFLLLLLLLRMLLNSVEFFNLILSAFVLS